MKRIAILGSTGSIGTQALDIIEAFPKLFCAEVLTANSNVDLLIEQAKKFVPNIVIIADENQYEKLSQALEHLPIKVFAGKNELTEVVSLPSIDMVLTATVGFSGLLPTLNAIKHHKTIALANKETLVVAGELIQKELQKSKSAIIPVDSEHSAIFQCLVGEMNNPIDKIYLTASGGPFRTTPMSEFKHISLQQALKHPNWSMGKKITIDSATMMNKGLEAIEARWLFDLKEEQIEILVHPESLVHSMVEFSDGSIKAQLGLPDMKTPIQYAFSYPDRVTSPFKKLSFSDYSQLHFEAADFNKFPCLNLAFEAMKQGGNMPCIMNAANEVAVDAFLKEQIQFIDIPNIIEKSMSEVSFTNTVNMNTLLETDSECRDYTSSLISNHYKK